MNTGTSKLGTGTKTMGCPKSILILKDAAVDKVKGNGPKQSKKHVTFDRFTKYYSYTENWQVKQEKTCPLSNDDWVALKYLCFTFY